MVLRIEETEFKKHKILSFKEGKRIYFSAGVEKCQLILENIEAIKAFVAKNTSPGPENKPIDALSEANGSAEA